MNLPTKRLVQISIFFLAAPFLFQQFSAVPVHAQTINDGDTIRVDGTIDVYIVKIVGTKKFKRLVLNPAIFNSYGQLSWSNIKDVDQATMNEFTDSNLVQHVNAQGVVVDPKIYAITSSANNYNPNKTGAKRWLDVTAAQFDVAGLDWDSIYKINDLEAADTFYPTDTALTTDDDLSEWATDVNGATQSQTSALAATTSEASAITSSSATLTGTVTPQGSTMSWFRYSATNPGSCNDTFGTRTGGNPVVVLSGTSAATSQSINGLSANTTYYFCAIAQNSTATVFGSVESFATSAAESLGADTGYVINLNNGKMTEYSQINDYEVWLYNNQNDTTDYYWTTDKSTANTVDQRVLNSQFILSGDPTNGTPCFDSTCHTSVNTPYYYGQYYSASTGIIYTPKVWVPVLPPLAATLCITDTCSTDGHTYYDGQYYYKQPDSQAYTIYTEKFKADIINTATDVAGPPDGILCSSTTCTADGHIYRKGESYSPSTGMTYVPGANEWIYIP